MKTRTVALARHINNPMTPVVREVSRYHYVGNGSPCHSILRVHAYDARQPFLWRLYHGPNNPTHALSLAKPRDASGPDYVDESWCVTPKPGVQYERMMQWDDLAMELPE